jgi:glutathione peroxidase
MKLLNLTIIAVLFVSMTFVSFAKNVHDFSASDIDGNEVNLSDYEGKVLLIVNVASKCGFTPQYEGLQKLYEQYKDKGFEILAFPCNQFAGQEPGSNEQIKEFCSSDYGVTFRLFDKVDVNGDNAHPLYKYLVSKKGFEGYDLSNPKAQMIKGVLEKNFPESLEGDSIKWNFTKFLIDKDGNVIERFETPVEPDNIKPAIDKLL